MKVEALRNIEDAYDLWSDSDIWFEDRFSSREKAYAKYFSENPNNFISIYKGQQIIATAIVFFDGRKCGLYRLAVREKFRRKGFARELISAAELLAKEHGAITVYGLVRRTNAKSKTLLLKTGFQEYSDAIYFSKDL